MNDDKRAVLCFVFYVRWICYSLLTIRLLQLVMGYQINALKGQEDVSPGQRPGKNEDDAYALKGQKNIVEVKLLPLRGIV
ncbi:MAG: hypothetical protein K6A98_08190 [Prevotella sp.]|nr:hypothetical protein [Prevotella sp.]